MTGAVKMGFFTLSVHCRRRQGRAEAIARVRVHGPLGPSPLDLLVAQCWLGLSSFGLSAKA